MSQPQTPTGPDAVDARRRLLMHIEQYAAHPELNPRTTAAALGWPVRRVHALLQGEPLSFMRLVTRARLERAQQLLARQPLPVIEVAFGCGFDSLATFYRQYRGAFGVAPGALRDSLLAARRARVEKTVPQATRTMARSPPT